MRVSRDSAVAAVATGIGVLLAMVLVWRTSSAAFTDTTDNSGNSFAAGSVSITDDDGGAALFTASGMVPGDSAVGCIEVTYAGDVTPGGPVEFYAASSDTVVGGDGLSDDLDVQVELAASGATCAALGSPSTLLATTPLASVNGIGSPLSTGWTPTLVTDVTRAFRITVTLGADTASDAQGESSTATFTWAVSS